ncbi:MAG: sigma factor-like helix-turn-helix DNA-binding protein [Patescibacteria group bacterium]
MNNNSKETKEVMAFKPVEVVKELLASLGARPRDVVKRRYGLATKETMTLEAVGQIYGITRERVRQIENATIAQIKKSEANTAAQSIFAQLKGVMEDYGGLVHEQEFLDHISKDQVVQNNVHFLLVLGDAFAKLKEDDYFHHRWTVDASLAEGVHQSLRNLCQVLDTNELVSEDKIVEHFMSGLDKRVSPEMARQKVKNWLKLSKEIGLSPVGEWGLAKSPNVRVRGIKDYAFLVMRRKGSPMHFTEVAKEITATFGRKTNAATSHNELIKDPRFVLVGRGLYALGDWGYTPGIVRDVIKQILDKNGAMTKAQVMAAVKKERYVKDNTILVNLKNPKFFKEDKKSGLFSNPK